MQELEVIQEFAVSLDIDLQHELKLELTFELGLIASYDEDTLKSIKLKSLLADDGPHGHLLSKIEWVQPQTGVYKEILLTALSDYCTKEEEASLTEAIRYLCGTLKNLNCHCFKCLKPHN